MLVCRVPGKSPVLFDSYASVPGPRWQPHLAHMQLTHPDVDQHVDTNRCGQLCLAAAAIFYERGLDTMWACA